MSCTAAMRTDEYHGWKCTITDGPCMYYTPSSERCAKDYDEGPDARKEDEIQEKLGD